MMPLGSICGESAPVCDHHGWVELEVLLTPSFQRVFSFPVPTLGDRFVLGGGCGGSGEYEQLTTRNKKEVSKS